MKLISVNIWEGRLGLSVARFLAKENPDVVCLQEVYSCSSQLALSFAQFNVLEFLQSKLNYSYQFFAPTWSFEFLGQKVSFGNAILSRVPLHGQEVFFNSDEYRLVKDPAEFNHNTRNAQFCSIDVGDHQVNLVNHHGYHEFNSMGSAASMEKMEILAGRVKLLKGPIILAGDLNVKSESPAMRVFDDWLQDLTTLHHLSSTLTQFAKVDNVACDHILISDEIKVKKFQASETLVSDHKPLILEFEL